MLRSFTTMMSKKRRRELMYANWEGVEGRRYDVGLCCVLTPSLPQPVKLPG